MAQKQLKTQNKTFNLILRGCEKANISVRKTGSGHYQIYIPNGEIMTVSATPRNKNTHKYVIAKLRKAGVKI
jgi:hypothetical protein